MNRKLNQILIKLKVKGQRLKMLTTGLLILTFNFLLLTCLSAGNPDTIQMTCRPNFGPPTSVTNLVATIGINTGEIDITWTVPAEDPAPQLGELVLNWPYHLRYSTNSLAALGDDTTAWWNQSSEYVQGWSEIGNGYGYNRAETLTFSSDYFGKIIYLAIRAEDSGHILAT
ncbi:MAG TPA: hypothetical protein DCX95_00345, partial [Elusimicrobia bacterium]|nr:hypothetical protein [Elusimicrobiota bacterium]